MTPESVDQNRAMPRPVLLVSACLCGRACRYDGGSFALPRLADPALRPFLLPLCPEVLGGLPVPRPPCEIRAGLVLCRDGSDATPAFERGAALCLAAAQKNGLRAALLKEKSPSCGSRLIYDGSFSQRLIPGMGLTAARLAAHGLRLFTEEELEQALEFLYREASGQAR